MLTTITTGISGMAVRASGAVADGFDPDIQVNENVPGAGLITDMAGGVFFYIYIILGVGLGLAAMLWGLGKIIKNQTMQTVGVGAIVTILVAACITGGVNGLIAWASRQSLT